MNRHNPNYLDSLDREANIPDEPVWSTRTHQVRADGSVYEITTDAHGEEIGCRRIKDPTWMRTKPVRVPRRS